MKTRREADPVVEARVYVDDPSVVFVFNGRFWTPARREDVEDVVVPVVTVVAKGRKYICRNATLEEALAGYEKCGATTKHIERPRAPGLRRDQEPRQRAKSPKLFRQR